MGQVNQIARLNFPGMDPVFQAHYQTMIDSVNSLAGYNGVIELKNHLSLGGSRVMNVGTAASGGDVVTQANADANYSAAALRPQLEANGTQPMQTMRQLNSQVQREQYSSFLNDTFSSPPSANNTQVLFTTSGSTTTITVPSGKFTYADGSSMPFSSRTDTVTNPNTVNISSMSVSGSIVTVNIASALSSGPAVNQVIGIANATGTGYNGSFPIATVISSTSFTVLNPNASGTTTGGTVTTVGVYYYFLVKGSTTLHVLGQATTTDTPFTRLPTSTDSRQLIALAVVAASGGMPTQSGGGGTALSTVNAGSFF